MSPTGRFSAAAAVGAAVLHGMRAKSGIFSKCAPERKFRDVPPAMGDARGAARSSAVRYDDSKG